MARRAHECVGILHSSIEHGLQCRDASASRKSGDDEALVSEWSGAVSGVATTNVLALLLDAC